MTDRNEIIRIDCSLCHGNGYVMGDMGEEACQHCGGLGMLEKEVPYSPTPRSKEEIKDLFGVQNFTQRPDPDATK